MITLKQLRKIRWNQHRSGWTYAMQQFASLEAPDGILFDGALDHQFSYSSLHLRDQGLIPYREPWIGFFHGTPKFCPFMENSRNLLDQTLASKLLWESLPFCKGIFTLSEYVAKHIRNKLDDSVSVVSLKHPTEFPTSTFDMDRFLTDKKIVHAGAWLRRFIPFYNLAAPGFQKILLLNPETLQYLGAELNYNPEVKIDMKQVQMYQHITNDDYDELLSSSIAFLSLCDCNASNTIIECLARNTPLLVNRLESVLEYLGEEYPFYYDNLDEAENKLNDIDLIYKTHHYMKTYQGKRELSGEYFLQSFLDSPIIRSLDH